MPLDPHAKSGEDAARKRESTTLHSAIYAALTREIQEGVYRPGDRLPSEAQLGERFSASRITVAKAIQSLQREGLVTRRAGSGTYVQEPAPTERYQFGLLIPQLGSTEIFEPICQGIMRAPLAKSHVLLWGYAPGEGDVDSDYTGKMAEQLCRQFIEQKVSGVFFAPLEYTVDREAANRRIVDMLTRAQVPVVLLDRCLESYPKRSEFDLVGIDNHRAGYTLTQHLWEAGSRRIVFVARKRSASTIVERISGYQFALTELQRSPEAKSMSRVLLGDVHDPKFVEELLQGERPDGIVCGNDLTAAGLMRSLLDRGVRIPDEIRIAGFDDVSYSKFLPVPLTTVRQDCLEIGRAALSLMLERLREPGRPGWEIRVPFELVMRQSSGWLAPRRENP